MRVFLSKMAVLVVGAATVVACSSADSGEALGDMAAGGAGDLQVRLDAARYFDLSSLPLRHLRLVTGNLTSGNNQSYEQAGIDIFRGLGADVAMVQELNVGGNSDGELRAFVDAAFGSEYAFTRAQVAGQIPNGIVSRYPIVAAGEWTDTLVSDRDFVWAQIDIPGPIDLYAISVHLLGSSAGARDGEADELVQHIRALPIDAYVVLGGDFNTSTRGEACVQTLSAVLATGGPYPVDQAGVDNTNTNRNKPYDWVLANARLEEKAAPVAIAGNVFDYGFVADTRVYSPISDLAPARATDSAASNMQHMAVVRDFGGPSPSPFQD